MHGVLIDELLLDAMDLGDDDAKFLGRGQGLLSTCFLLFLAAALRFLYPSRDVARLPCEQVLIISFFHGIGDAAPDFVKTANGVPEHVPLRLIKAKELSLLLQIFPQPLQLQKPIKLHHSYLLLTKIPALNLLDKLIENDYGFLQLG